MASNGKVTSSAASGRYQNVSEREARAAARAQVTIDQRRGRATTQWIKDLADGKKTG